MARPTVTICKFVGTITLGLLTGQSLTLSLTALPALSSLSSAEGAEKAHSRLAALSRRQTALLSTLSASAFLIAYALSPRRLRHPYLLYATIAVVGGWGGEVKDYYFGSVDSSSNAAEGPSAAGKKSNNGGKGKGKGMDRLGGSVSESTVVMTPPTGSPGTSDEEWEVENEQQQQKQQSLAGSASSSDLNGEVVQESIDRRRKRSQWKSGIWTLGWTLSLVGLWGDGL